MFPWSLCFSWEFLFHSCITFTRKNWLLWCSQLHHWLSRHWQSSRICWYFVFLPSWLHYLSSSQDWRWWMTLRFFTEICFDCFEALALICSLHQSISSTTVLQLQQRSLLERIRELNDEIQSISYALNNNNNSGKVPSTPQLPRCTEKADIVGSGVKKKKKSSVECECF